MKLALYQGAGIASDVPANLSLLTRVAAESVRGVDLLVLPELFLTGYNIGDDAWRLAEPVDGPSIQAIKGIARDCKLALLCGYCELDEGHVYNSAALIDRDGNLVANYRKTHLYGNEERRLFVPGSQLAVHAIAGIKVGVLICYDIEFPEAVRCLAARGAELIAVPTALTIPSPQMPTAREIANILVPARALENQVFVAYVNRCGTEGDLTYCGSSCVVGPDGRELARAGAAETLLVAAIDVEAIAKERSVYSYLDERRPKLYDFGDEREEQVPYSI